MALTPEQLDQLIQQADGLAPKEGSIFRALVKLTEAEVRKQDTELIRQMLDALELPGTKNHQMLLQCAAAERAARAWLGSKP